MGRHSQPSPVPPLPPAVAGIGFKYAVPELTADTLREPVAMAIAQGIFPPVL